MTSRTNTEPPTAQAQLLTPEDVASILQISPRAVRRLHQAGQLRATRLGYRTVRYTTAEVDRFIAAHQSDD